MTEEGKVVMRAAKVANIIQSLCNLYNISMQKAADMYYKSVIAAMIEERVADLHCSSDKYLASQIWEEYNPEDPQTTHPQPNS
ncbi:MAG: DUF3791 domain-containing protein [Muribaculaceae bacterium]|nr:DUF3791 domain-containing protein [Muribaculaceae bacterium]